MTWDITAKEFPALWAGYINDGRVEDVINLYADGATLMPTFSPHTVKTREGLVEYFNQLASRQGLEVSLHEKTVDAMDAGNNTYVVSGIYSFRFEVDETLLTFPSRFTFFIDLSSGQPVRHHHSSQIPRTLT